MKRALIVALCLTSCTSGDREGDSSVPGGASVAAADQVDSLLAEMPRHPRAPGGRLVAVSAGNRDLSGQAAARAGRCEEPSMVQIVAEDVNESSGESWAVLLLLQVPEEEKTGEYPVAIVESGFPEPPAAQIAVQVISSGRVEAFQGSTGSAEIYAFDDRISGRFAITVRNINNQDLIQIAGSFRAIEILELPAESCLAAAAEGGA